MGGLKKEDSGKKSPSVKSKKYIITSAQACATPHRNFMDGLERYSKENGSEIIILPMIGMSAREGIKPKTDDEGNSSGGLADFFQKYDVEFERRKLNNNLHIEQFYVQPQNIDPLTSQLDFAYTSVIFASPKQRMKAISDSNFKMPRLVVTTGACTLPRYANPDNSTDGERWRRGSIARKQHIFGGWVVEIEGDERFHLRNIRATGEGKFVDLGKKYDGNDVSKSELEAIVYGDWHVGYTDPFVRKANYEMMRNLKPKKIILHDFLDMHSVNHHNRDQLITGLLREGVDKNFLSLEEEFKTGREELMKINDAMDGGEIYIIPSNHHDFLVKYLNRAEFVKDPYNLRISLKLATELGNGNDPIEEGLNMMGKLPSNIIFLRRNQDLKIRGIQLGAHGDKGPGGSGGSMNTLRRQFRKSITGHIHSAEVKGDTYRVGTSTPLNLPYTIGSPTDWTNTNACLYDNGTVQMINIIDGKWRAK